MKDLQHERCGKIPFCHFHRSQSSNCRCCTWLEMMTDSKDPHSTVIKNNSKSRSENIADENSTLGNLPTPAAKKIKISSIPPTTIFQNTKKSRERLKRRASLYNLHDSTSIVKKVRIKYVVSHRTIGLPRNYSLSENSSRRSNHKRSVHGETIRRPTSDEKDKE